MYGFDCLNIHEKLAGANSLCSQINKRFDICKCSQSCTCNDNWFGTACNKNQTNELITRIRCTNTNDDMNRCHNNGLCYQSTSNTNDKICICSKGYTGENCTKCDDGYELDSASSSSTTTIKCKSVCALTGMEHCYGHGTCNTMTKTCTCTSNTSLIL